MQTYTWINKRGNVAYIVPKENGKIQLGTINGEFPRPYKTMSGALKALRRKGYKPA